MKHLCILGSTGSIGRNTLEIVGQFPDRFRVLALAAKSSVELLARQIERFHPELAVVGDSEDADRLSRLVGAESATEILYGEIGYRSAVIHSDVHTVVAAIMGGAGLAPTLAAVNEGKDVALANKETLVMAGDIVMEATRRSGSTILPVDSEHSAIFQSLTGQRQEDLDKILLTASGGPFRNTPREAFEQITPEQALDHPNWAMGPKITIDSATLMNKGLEVLEARALFDVAIDRIEVLIHPQSIIHSMVAYRDGSVIAQLGIPDMKGAIAYALSYPERLPLGQPLPDFSGIGELTFEAPDLDRFPCLAMALEAGRRGGTAPAVMNAANESAVAAFLGRRIPFTAIPEVIHRTMKAHPTVSSPGLESILDADRWARETSEAYIKKCLK